MSIPPEVVLQVTARERKCTAFYQWMPGYGPKEHREMMQANELRSWQEEQKRTDREWHDAQETKNREWQEKQARRNWWRSVIAGILVTIVSTWLAWFFKGDDKPIPKIDVHLDLPKATKSPTQP
jgi:hypothetical protein